MSGSSCNASNNGIRGPPGNPKIASTPARFRLARVSSTALMPSGLSSQRHVPKVSRPPQGDPMSTTPQGPANDPSFVNENALRVASESLTRYDETTDTYHCSYGPPLPGITGHDAEP